MKYIKTTVIGAAIAILCAIMVAAPSLAWEHPPEMDPEHGWGHHMFGEDGDFFVTAAGNNPYITFHVRGNSTLQSVFRVKFERLIYFNDTDMNGKYIHGVDPITNELVLSTLSWAIGNLTYNNGVFNVTLNATAPGFFGQMKIVVHYNNGTATNISNQLKFDIIIVNMNLAAYNNGDHVAIKNQLLIEIDNDGNGTHRFLNGTGTDEDSIVVSRTTNPADSDAKFSWVENGKLNGTERLHACNGTARDDSDDMEELFVESIYLAFPRFVNLTYDPTISVTPITAASTPPAVPGFDTPIMVAEIAVVSGALAFVTRRAILGGRKKGNLS